jgi:hypothetical protein
MNIGFILPEDMFPILTKIQKVRSMGGEESVEYMLALLTPEERQQLNVEVSMLISGTTHDPFIDYLRMRQYISN